MKDMMFLQCNIKLSSRGIAWKVDQRGRYIYQHSDFGLLEDQQWSPPPLSNSIVSEDLSLRILKRLHFDLQKRRSSVTYSSRVDNSAMATDLTNWRTPGHTEWSFQNVDKVLNTRTIKTGDQKKPLDYQLREVKGFNLSREGQPSLDLDAWLQETSSNGLVVLRNDKIVYETYDRTNNAESKHILFSLTKSVTGLLAGILASQGKLDVNASVTKYVPEVKGTSLENAIVRDCLDMRSGIKYDDNSHAYRAAMGWEPLRDDDKAKNLQQFLSSFHAESTGKAQGVEGWPFNYASVNTDLMGWILERASGKKFAELASELLWKPMGAESDALIAVDSEGSARAAGGMCVVLRDLARMGQLVLHDGDGIVPAEWVRDLRHGGSQEAWAAGPWSAGFKDHLAGVSYRSFWYSSRSEDVLVGMGIHGQMLLVDRKRKMVLAKTSSQAIGADMKMIQLTIDGLKEVCRVLDE